MSSPKATAPAPAPSPWKKVLLLPLLATLLVTLVGLAMTWPMQTMETKDITISVVGSDEQVQQLETQLAETGREDAFDLITAKTREEAVTQIEERQSYGSIVFSDAGAPEILTAQAANAQVYALLNGMATQMTAQIQGAASEGQSAALTQAITEGNSALEALAPQIADAQARTGEENREVSEQAAAQLAELTAQREQLTAGITAAQAQFDALAAQGEAKAATTVTATNVAPYSEQDPSGLGLSMAYLPTMLGGIIGGALISLGIISSRQRLVAMLIYGVLAGLALSLVFVTWFAALPLSFGAAWLLYSASLLATGLFIVGVGVASGKAVAGVGAGALVTMFIGNPLSGMMVPASFVWGGLGYLGQWFVPGATNALLRYESYFPAADTSAYWLTLVLWMCLGLALIALGITKEAKAQRDPQLTAL